MFLVVKENNMTDLVQVEQDARVFAAVTQTAREIAPALGALHTFKFKGNDKAAKFFGASCNTGFQYSFLYAGRNLAGSKVKCKIDWSRKDILVLHDENDNLVACFTEREAEEHLVHMHIGYCLFKLWKKIRHKIQ